MIHTEQRTAVAPTTPQADRLARFKAHPRLVEDAVRSALQDAVAWRIGGGVAPSTETFATAAVASARQRLDALGAESAERSRTLNVVAQAARGLRASPLGQRLMSVPPSQFVPLDRGVRGPDVIVRDRHRRLHAITLELRCTALEAGQTATAVARRAPLPPADRLSPLTVHVFSLLRRRRYTFERESVPRANARVA